MSGVGHGSARWVLGLVVSLVLGGCEPGRGVPQPKVQRDHVAVIDLRFGISEVIAGDGFFPVPAADTFVGLVRELEKMRSNEKVRAIFVRLGPGIPLHQVTEVGRGLDAIRKTGRPVVCHTHQVDNANVILLLHGCDERWVSAAGDVSTVGIAAEVTYVKGALDKLGVVADMMAVGEYKSGGESLTREGPSDAAKQNLTEVLQNLRRVWLAEALMSQAGKEPARVLAALEDGPWTPDAALREGLVTHVGFEDEALDKLKAKVEVSITERHFGPGSARGPSGDLVELVRLLAGAHSNEKKTRIAVLPAVGSITMAASGPFGDPGITASGMVRAIRKLREDDGVRAIVLRLDSPGGSPLASDLIWREVMLTKQVKPVVVSVGSMAASGGYYIASAGTKIVASPSAIVGSIGVFGGKIVLGEALSRYGITTHAFPANPDPKVGLRALHLSPFTAWDEATRQRVQESMQRIYDLFVERVAEGRSLAKEAVYKTAEGAVFLADTGQERGLVDELGGVGRAIELARELAELPEDIPVSVEGARENVLESLFLGDEPEAEEVRDALAQFVVARQRAMLEFGPQAPEIVEKLRPLRASLEPLLQGENVTATLPYALSIR